MHTIDAHTHRNENEEGNSPPHKAKPKIKMHEIIAVALIALGFIWFNFSFVIAALTFFCWVFAIFLLCFGSIYSAKLMFKPRRIVSTAQADQGMTLLQHMQETQRPDINPFMGLSMRESPTKDPNVTPSWEVQKGINFESSACFLWFLSIIFLTLTTVDRSIGFSVIASLAVMGLFINWLIQMRFFLAWQVINKKPATTEHYGIWLFERIQYGFVVAYCLGFIGEKIHIF